MSSRKTYPPSSHLTKAIFQEYRNYVSDEHKIREDLCKVCKRLEQISCEAASELQIIHTDEKAIVAACRRARELFALANECYQEMVDIVPTYEYYKYHDYWRIHTQKLSYLICLTLWLEDGSFSAMEPVADMLHIGVQYDKCGFHLEAEDYLMGQLQLCSEMARLSVNAVTRGDYHMPLQISKYVADINVNFRLLNLKNDPLRKRYDALKYDVKKIEEVVYDLSIRGLVPTPVPSEAPA